LRGKASLSVWVLIAAAIMLPSCGEVVNNPSPNVTSLSPSSVNAGAPGFTLTVNGSGLAPQSLVYWNGAAVSTIFLTSDQVQATIPSTFISTPGSALIEVQTPAPGGGISTELTFTINPVNSLIPELSSISPSSGLAGNSQFEIELTGNNFESQSEVLINGDAQTTSFLDSQELEADIPTSYLTTAGELSISVLNPAPGGGASQALPLTITYAVPAITKLSPTSAAAGGNSQTLTVTGTGMTPGTVIMFNGSPRTTNYSANTSVTAVLTESDLFSAQVAQITAVNPSPGGGPSVAEVFGVDGIVPALSRPGYTGLPELVDYSYLGLGPNAGVGNLNLSGPSISSDGRYVAYASAASNLVYNDTNGATDVFLTDTCYATTGCVPSNQLVSISGTSGSTSPGTQGNAASFAPSLNSTGSYIAFSSYATNLDPNYPTVNGSTQQVFLHGACVGSSSTAECSTAFTELVSVAADGVNPANADATQASVSSDGRYVAFVSTATNLVPGVNTNGVAQVYLRDTCLSTTTSCTPTTELVSSPDGVTPGDEPSSQPSVATSGLYVSYTSAASNLISGVVPTSTQIFRTETCISGLLNCIPILTLVSSNDGVTTANAAASESSITADGRYVAFASAATNLVEAASSGVQQVYVRDTCGSLTTGCTTSTTLISVANDNVTPGNALSEQPSVSSITSGAGDAEFVAFASLATNLASGTTNGFENVFVRNTCNNASSSPTCIPGTILLSTSQNGTLANNVSIYPAISGSGHDVAFISPATNLVPNYSTGLGDVFITGTTY
jgi:trimeric autotransporter adhesin